MIHFHLPVLVTVTAGSVDPVPLHNSRSLRTFCGEVVDSGYITKIDDLHDVDCGVCRVEWDKWLAAGQPELWEDMKKLLLSYDWREAFAYASAQPVDLVGVEVVVAVKETKYEIAHVKRLIASDEGENDVRDWILVAEMLDGRFMFLNAGCDYTGWDCRAGGSAWWAPTLELLVQRGLTDAARERLKLHDAREFQPGGKRYEEVLRTE